MIHESEPLGAGDSLTGEVEVDLIRCSGKRGKYGQWAPGQRIQVGDKVNSVG